jgi:hypothetical protein
MPFIPRKDETRKCHQLWCIKHWQHPEHSPPDHIVLPPGRHVWECPSCGYLTTIYIQQPGDLL